MVKWQQHTVAQIPSGYQVAVADINGDGRLDILALSSEESIVEWYENPSWKPRPVTTMTRHNISLAPLFRGNYPERGLALASDFALNDSTSGGSVWWGQPGDSLDSEWPLHLLGRIPTSHRLRWADLDGSGRLGLVDVPLLGYGAKEPGYEAPAPLTWFESPEPLLRGHVSATDTGQGEWTPHLIDDSLTVVHGVQIIDWDNDGRDEILTASFEGVHLFHSAGMGPDLRWTKTHLAAGDQLSTPRRGSSEIGVGRLDGRHFLATIEPWHGEHVVVYTREKAGELWSRHPVDDSFHDGHALLCADLDGDGNDEIVAGFRGPGTSLYVYYALDASGLKWERQTLDTQMAASGVVTADINGDGRLDLVAIGASTANVKWYENLGANA
ncbi:MAG: VCBS repeat-containing protein [Terriglobia bacterium]|jgi:hypothetical protein